MFWCFFPPGSKDNCLAAKHTHIYLVKRSIIPDIPEVTALETSASCTLLLLFGPVCRSAAKDYSSKCRSMDWLTAASKEKVYKSHSITSTAFHNFTTQSVKVVCSHSPPHSVNHTKKHQLLLWRLIIAICLVMTFPIQRLLSQQTKL